MLAILPIARRYARPFALFALPAAADARPASGEASAGEAMLSELSVTADATGPLPGPGYGCASGGIGGAEAFRALSAPALSSSAGVVTGRSFNDRPITRSDDIRVGLFNTTRRMTSATVRDDRVEEASPALYLENRLRWTDWLRTSLGVRADGYEARVASDNPLNSGQARDGIVSPKLGLVLGPWAETEFFVNYGEGFHSNDARGATITVDPGNPLFPLSRVPLLVRSVGSEVGLRNRSLTGLESTVTPFQLDRAAWPTRMSIPLSRWRCG